ncbi:MAG TPA: crotonase/enoyl-CoA hydratase family protein [Woeseiaceae bacterium]|nr:crotonase/enoyl-CoA hydratase family protein [Woeseiaceae bacterium]
MSGFIQYTTAGHVAEVTLDRPDKRNALTLEMFHELAAVADRIGEDRSVRAVVLSGAGADFCAGIDTSLFAGGIEQLADLMRPRAPSPANVFQRAAYAWRELSVPVICAIEGSTFGAGLQIALAADLRYAAPDAQFSIMEIKWGLIPDMAISAVARGLLSEDKLRELAYTGRVVAAPEAEQLGLVTAVTEQPRHRAREVAQLVAARSPDAISALKKLINEAWQQPPHEALATEARLQLALIGGANQLEAVRANQQRRPPVFVDPSKA